jgi:hypothetical protein
MDLNLEKITFKGFKVRDLFRLETGAVASFSKMVLGDKKLDCVGATSRNNGNVGFVDSRYGNLAVDGNCIVFIRTGEGSVGDAIYKGNTFIPSKNVSIGRSEKLNRYTASFLVNIINKQAHKYNYGYVRSDDRLENEILLLPTDSQGNPDYVFMEAYMKDLEQKMLERYKHFIEKRLLDANIQGGVRLLDDREWREFYMQDIFYIKSGVRLTKADMSKGSNPFIGATDSNNGITEFTSHTNNSEDRNVLGVNYNGSVVENFYHPYTAIFSDDVKRLSFRNTEGNKYLYLFAKTQILKQRAKYKYGYKFNARRMSKQKIMLPTNQTGKPDYEFMENYMKTLEHQKIKQYLDKRS